MATLTRIRQDIKEHNEAVRRIKKEKMPSEYDGWRRLAAALHGMKLKEIKPVPIPSRK